MQFGASPVLHSNRVLNEKLKRVYMLKSLLSL